MARRTGKKSVRRRPTQEFKRKGVSVRQYATKKAKMGMAGLMPCTQKYVHSIVDPAGEAGRGACVPSGYPIPSQKVRAFERGTFSTGTTGTGYIAFTPTLANDNICVMASSATSVMTNATAINAATNVVSYFQNKLPYSTAELAASTVEGRFISGGLKIRYAGQEDLRSGIIGLFEDPDHLGTGASTVNGIASQESCERQRVTGEGKWSEIYWSGPSKSAESEYKTAPFYSPQCIIATVDGTVGVAGAAGPAVFEWEAWSNVEYIGRIAVGKTASDVDAQGFGLAQQGLKTAQATSISMTSKSLPKIIELMTPKHGGTFVGNALSSVVHSINPAAGRIYEGFRSGFNRFITNRSNRYRRTN